MAIRKIDFPDHNDPSFDPTEEFEAPNGITYSWNGYGWEVGCGFEDPTCDLDRNWNTVGYTPGGSAGWIDDEYIGITNDTIVFQGDQSAYLEAGNEFEINGLKFEITNVEVTTEQEYDLVTKLTVTPDPINLLNQGPVTIVGLCDPIGKRYLLAHGDDVKDCDGPVTYKWNEDVHIQADNKDIVIEGEELAEVKAFGFVKLTAAEDDVQLTANNRVLSNSGGETEIKSSQSYVALEAAAHRGELVNRTIDETSDSKQIVNKEYVDAETSQLHQDIISLDEEIESIARSSDKGFWRYEQPTSETRPPFPGKFFLLKNYTPGTGAVGAVFTNEYEEANAAVFHNIEWNVDQPDGSGGEAHTWADVEVGDLIDILDKPDPDGLFGRITDIDLTAHAGVGVIIGFDTIEFLGRPNNNAPFQSLLKIFKEPDWRHVLEEFVKKEGNAGGHMTGDLTLNTTNGNQVYDPRFGRCQADVYEH